MVDKGGIIPWICDNQNKKIYNLCPASASLPATTLPPLPSQKITSLTSNLATIMCATIACWVLTCPNYNVLPWEGGGVAEPEGVYVVVTNKRICDNLQLVKPKIELWSKWLTDLCSKKASARETKYWRRRRRGGTTITWGQLNIHNRAKV